MKKVLVLIIAFCIISCNQSKKEKSNDKASITEIVEETANFDWLLGEWIRTNEVQGKETFENWKKVSVDEYTGIGFTIKNGDTIKQEKMHLAKADDKWELNVKVLDETESVTFNMSSFSANEFICENHEIDFPNTIKYWKDGDLLNATVANGEMKIEFKFQKKDTQ